MIASIDLGGTKSMFIVLLDNVAFFQFKSSTSNSIKKHTAYNMSKTSSFFFNLSFAF